MKLGKQVLRTGLLASAALAAASSVAMATPASAESPQATGPEPGPKVGTSQPAPNPKVSERGVTPLFAPCGTNGDRTGPGFGNTLSNNVNIRTGSSTTCGSRGQAQTSHTLNYRCWTSGNDGFTWTYLTNETTGISGWIRDDLLSGNGSPTQCFV